MVTNSSVAEAYSYVDIFDGSIIQKSANLGNLIAARSIFTSKAQAMAVVYYHFPYCGDMQPTNFSYAPFSSFSNRLSYRLVPKCVDSNFCSGHGTCNIETNSCACYSGYALPNCTCSYKCDTTHGICTESGCSCFSDWIRDCSEIRPCPEAQNLHDSSGVINYTLSTSTDTSLISCYIYLAPRAWSQATTIGLDFSISGGTVIIYDACQAFTQSKSYSDISTTFIASSPCVTISIFGDTDGFHFEAEYYLIDEAACNAILTVFESSGVLSSPRTSSSVSNCGWSV